MMCAVALMVPLSSGVSLPVLADRGDWSDVVSALLIAAIAHLAWPATVLTLAWMFREPVRSLLGRVQSTRSKYGEVTFGSGKLAEKLGQAEAIADALALPPAIAAVSPIDNHTTAHEAAVTQGLRTAARRPQTVIVDTWQFLLDDTCRIVARRSGKRPGDAVAAIAKHVDSETLGLVLRLMLLKEEAIAGGSAGPVKDDAVRYVKLVSRAHQRIAERLPQADSGVLSGNSDMGDET